MKRPLLEDKFTQVVMSVLGMLLASGVVGLWTMSVSLGRLDERVANWMKSGNEKIEVVTTQTERVNREQRDLDKRISILEGMRRPN